MQSTCSKQAEWERAEETSLRPESRHSWAALLIVFLLALTLYASTASRGVQWQDSGDRMLRVLRHDLLGSMGLALSHPLHHLFGRLMAGTGILEPCLAVTLLSGLMGALAVTLVFGCVRTITADWRAAAFAAGSLALAHTFWQLSTLTEVYTTTAALLAGECWCLAVFVRGKRAGLYGMFLLNGLGLANHLLATLTAPVLAVVALIALWQKRISLKHLAIAVGLWMLGSLPYTTLVAIRMVVSGNVPDTIRSALFGTAYAKNVLNARISVGMLGRSAGFIAYNFPNLLIPAAVLGIVRAGRAGVPKLLHAALLAGLIVHAAFVMRYNIADQQTFFLPVYVFLAIFGGIGASRVIRATLSAWRRVAVVAAVVLLVLTPVWYALTPKLAKRLKLLDAATQRPYRDSYVYLFVPWSVADRSAERMANEALKLAGPDGLILYEDRMAAFALEYKQIRSGLVDVSVAAMPASNNASGRTRFESLVRERDGRLRRTVLVPTDVRKKPANPPGMAWVPYGPLFVLESVASQPHTSTYAAGG